MARGGGSFYFSGSMFEEQNENPVRHHKPPQNLNIVEKDEQEQIILNGLYIIVTLGVSVTLSAILCASVKSYDSC